MLQRSIYSLVACLATVILAACADRAVFDQVGPRSDETAAAEWPRLADTPPTPPQGVYTTSAPDPATGETVQIDLAVAAETAERRRKAVEGPVE